MSDNTLDYVVHSGFVYEADEWYNSYDGQRYDDLECYWSKGIKPSYVM